VAGGALLMLLAGSARRPQVLGSEVHLLETGLVPGSGSVEPQAIHGDDRRSLNLQPPATARFRARVPDGAWLVFGLAARPVGASLVLRVEADGALLHQEHSQTVAPWSERRVDLTRLAGRDAELRIRVEGPLERVVLGEPKLLAPRPARDNLLVYVVDCLRADRLGVMGDRRRLTPSIDALAREGAVFERAYACAGWTKPSVGCLLTGLNPVRHGARGTDHDLRAGRITLAEALRRSGFATGAVVANPVLDGRAFGFSRGFDDYIELAREWKGRAVNSTPADAAQVTDAALQWLDRHRDRRFFLYAHSIDLHYPYLARPGFEAAVRPTSVGLERDSDLYDSELAYTDREIGRLLAGLGELGLEARTNILITSDHGEAFGEHGSSRHGRSLFDELLHVPLLLKRAGSQQARRIPYPVGHVDLLPTLLDLDGAAPVEHLDGVSLRGAIEGGRLPERPLFAEQVAGGPVIYAVRFGRFKLIHEILPDPRQMLFDLEDDPGERSDVSAQAPAEAALRAALLKPFLMSGQAGLHLVLADPPPGRTLHLVIRSAARLADVLRVTVRAGDTLEFAPNGRQARLAFVPAGLTRHLVIRTDPPGSPVSVDFGGGLRPADLRLGEDTRPARSLPATLVPSELQIASPSSPDPLPGKAWAFAILPARAPEVRAELQEQMRALGYLQ